MPPHKPAIEIMLKMKVMPSSFVFYVLSANGTLVFSASSQSPDVIR